MQSIKRDYCKQLYANKTDNLEKMDKFLGRFSVLRLNQEENKKQKTMHNPFTNTEIEAVIKNLWKKKTKVQDQMASEENSIKHLVKS